MTGLFSRLAEQQLGQRRQAISSVRQPQFKTDLAGHSEGDVDHVYERSEPTISPDNKSIPISSRPANPETPELQPASERDGMTSITIPALEPVVKMPPAENVSQPGNVHQSQTAEPAPQRSELPSAKLLTPLRSEASDAITSRPNVTPARSVSEPISVINKAKKNATSTENQLSKSIIPKPEQTASIRVDKSFGDRNVKPSSHDVRSNQETTVNVTIGRIEVKAHSDDGKKTQPAKPKSRRQAMMSLDEYQAKRQRGER